MAKSKRHASTRRRKIRDTERQARRNGGGKARRTKGREGSSGGEARVGDQAEYTASS